MTPLIKQPKAKQPIKIIDFGTKKPRLSIDGHIYHFGHQQAGYQLYYCQNRTRSNCMASLKYWTKELRYTKFGLHNHPADGVKAEALLVQAIFSGILKVFCFFSGFSGITNFVNFLSSLTEFRYLGLVFITLRFVKICQKNLTKFCYLEKLTKFVMPEICSAIFMITLDF